MSTFFESVCEVWPDVDWHGRSSIHVSICEDNIYHGLTKREALKAAVEGGTARLIYNKLCETFPQFEWLITQDDFESRCYVDLYRHSKGMGDTQSDTKLTNPSTGNVFHRIVLRDAFVGGIRFWMEGSDGEYINVGWRFRIQQLDENEADTRDRANKQAVADGITMLEVMDEINLVEPKKVKSKTAAMEEELEHEDFVDSALEGEDE